MKTSFTQQWPKFLIGWVLCFAVRLLPFRPPNVEPILAATMPFARRLGPWSGFFFAFLSIVLFDAVTSGIGTWTIITSITYGLVGVGAYFVLKHMRSRSIAYAFYAVIATLFYDAVTGVAMGPLLYGQPFMEALLGQIPFTINHLVSNVILAAVFSPLIERWIVQNSRLEVAALIRAQKIS